MLVVVKKKNGNFFSWVSTMVWCVECRRQNLLGVWVLFCEVKFFSCHSGVCTGDRSATQGLCPKLGPLHDSNDS